MARSFNGSTQTLERANGIVTAYPFSIAYWANTSNNTARQFALTLNTAVNDTGYQTGLAGDVANDPAEYRFGEAVIAAARTSNAFSVNAWQHIATVSASATSHAITLNGVAGSKGTSSASYPFPSGGTVLNGMVIGARKTNNTTYGNRLTGSVAYPCIWNVALTDDDIAALAAGHHPWNIRPGSIISCWDLDKGGSPDPDITGLHPLTLVGSPPQVDDPRIILPSLVT